jgi:hypothetical protein
MKNRVNHDLSASSRIVDRGRLRRLVDPHAAAVEALRWLLLIDYATANWTEGRCLYLEDQSSIDREREMQSWMPEYECISQTILRILWSIGEPASCRAQGS